MFPSKNNIKKASPIKGKDPKNLFYKALISLKESISTLGVSLKDLLPSSPIYLLPVSIYAIKALEALMQIFAPDRDWISNDFFYPFIERFGVIYGILLPLILVRVWEQLDDLDRAFDKEADAVKTFYDEIFFLRGKNKTFVKEIAESLYEYVSYIINNYQDETKKQVDKKVDGDRILEKTMGKLKGLFRTSGLRTKEEEIIIPKLIDKLNDIIDLRGDRIAIASQRLFESLHIVALIASIIFVIPFYFESFTPKSGVLDDILTISVTLLVVVIFVIIEDFDEPFDGAFKIEADSWERILNDMETDKRKSELDNLDKPTRKESVTWHSRNTDNKKKTGRKTDSQKSRAQRK